MPSGFRQTPTYETCPATGGRHRMKHVFSGEYIRISKCQNCSQEKWRAYRKTNYDNIRADLAKYEATKE